MSEQLREQRNAAVKEKLHFVFNTSSGGTRTTDFKCGRCKNNDCTYTQAQTRRCAPRVRCLDAGPPAG